MNINKFSNILNSTPQQIAEEYEFKKIFRSPLLYYRKGRPNKQCPVLGVAHLDTVIPPPHTPKFSLRSESSSKLVIKHPCLDDRLGVFILLELLKNIPIDIILTTEEEKCRSSAQFFYPEREYNWIFSFDRRGTDVVVYQYQNPKWLQALQLSHFEIGVGSYSDIVELSHLGVCGVNIGTGYYEQHTMGCYMIFKETMHNIRKFRNFFWRHCGTKYKWI